MVDTHSSSPAVTRSPVLYLVGSALCLSVGSVATKGLLSGVAPLSFLAAQLVGSLTLLWLLVVLRGLVPTSAAAVRPLVMVGAVIGAGALCTILALDNTSASEAALVFATQPALIVAIAFVLLGERIGWPLIVLGLVAVAGVAMIVADGRAGGSLVGNLFAFGSTALSALYVVLMRRITQRTHPLAALAVVQTTALAICLVAIQADALHDLNRGTALSAQDWVGAALTGALYYGVAFWVYLIGLQRIAAAMAGLYLNLVPVFTIGLAAGLLGEALSAEQWIGAGIVLAAVFWISLRIARQDRA